MTLADLGWNAWFEEAYTPFRDSGWQPARLIRDNRISYGAAATNPNHRLTKSLTAGISTPSPASS